MRKEGWANQGYYPTPERVADMVASDVTLLPYRQVQIMDDTRHQCRILDPCCGEGIAVRRFTDVIESRASPKFQAITYGLEINRERAQHARQILNQVWHADVDQTRVYPNTYHCLWLNPPYDWDRDPEADATQRLESRFLHKCTPGLVANGLLVYIVPYHVLRHDAQFLAVNYDQIKVHRFPDPEFDDYRQIVVTGRRRPDASNPIGQRRTINNLRSMAQPDNLPPPLRDAGNATLRMNVEVRPEPYMFPPLRVLRYSPNQVRQALSSEGLWNKREMGELLDSDYSVARIRPLEKLPDGHAAMAAANSMVDNALIPGATADDDPIIVRGFFRKRNRETMRTADTVVRTDQFESNIRAMNARTGEVEEVGSDPQGLKTFMDIYGPAIRKRIDAAYPPAIDIDAPQCQTIRERINQLKRPLIGKQVEAAIIAAAHLKRNPHLNLFFTQGSGKTCTAYGVAHGFGASKVAVITPSRVVRTWISEIRAVWPDAIVRVVDNRRPIGQRRPPHDAELRRRPSPSPEPPWKTSAAWNTGPRPKLRSGCCSRRTPPAPPIQPGRACVGSAAPPANPSDLSSTLPRRRPPPRPTTSDYNRTTLNHPKPRQPRCSSAAPPADCIASTPTPNASAPVPSAGTL